MERRRSVTPFIAETMTMTFEDCSGGTDEIRGVQHALGPEQRTAAEFQGNDGSAGALPLDRYWRPSSGILQRSNREMFNCAAFSGHFFLHVFGTHDIRS